MDNLQQYMDLFAGRLDENTESKLLSDLSLDSNMRTEFKSYVLLTDGIKRSMDTFEPSSHVKSRIYAKAGYNSPGVNSSNSAGKFVNGKLFTGLVSGLATAITTIIIMLSIIPQNRGIMKIQNAENKNSIKTEQNEIPKIVSHEVVNLNNNSNPIIKYVYVEKEPEKTSINAKNEIVNRENIQNQELLVSEPVLLNNNQIKKTNNANIENDFLNLPATSGSNNLFETDNATSSSDRRYSIGLRNFVNWNIPNETVYPAQISNFNNLGLELCYSVSDNIFIGADLRQETFFGNYQGKDNEGNLKNYEQQPNLTSYGFVFKYIFFEYNNFKINSQFNMDFNTYGYIVRPMIGFEYNLYPNLSVSSDLEYGRMWFNHQGKLFNTSKIGINYGINYKF